MNIDYKLLQAQKLELVGLAMENQTDEKEIGQPLLTKEQADALDGVISLLDAIQDEQEDENKALKTPTELKEKWMNKLEESKNQLRKFQAHDTPWDFVEEYYPNYSSSDEICACLDLMLKEETNDLSQEEMEQKEYYLKEIYEQAIENFIQSQNK